MFHPYNIVSSYEIGTRLILTQIRRSPLRLMRWNPIDGHVYKADDWDINTRGIVFNNVRDFCLSKAIINASKQTLKKSLIAHTLTLVCYLE